MATSSWDKLGQAASVMQLTGVDGLGLVSMIVQAAQIARRNRDLCLQLAEHVQTVGGLLRNLQIPELRRYPETRRPLDQLNETLLRTYMLVRFCSEQQENTSQLYQMLTGAGVADKLRRAQEEIDRYITLIPMITTVAVVRARDALREEAQDDVNNDPTSAQRPLQRVTEPLALEGPAPIRTVAVQIQEERLQRGDPSSLNDCTNEFTLDQLRRATNGFSPALTICQNDFFGTWYRGILGNMRVVAVKRLPRTRRFKKEYRPELAFISSLQHRHLAGLVGYCVAPVDGERLLVYDYMKNGSLYRQLRLDESPVVSSWKLRIKVLLDASRGIDYLHSSSVQPLVHGNIRSGNILLEHGWTARVSDFMHSLMEPEVHCLRAIGYLDPEHDALQRLTVKSDVYSFGVVMLEVLTGKQTIFEDAEGGRPVSLVNYAVPSIAAGELREVLDPRAPELAEHEAHAVELVASTAMLCVQPEGKDRLADIVIELETAVALCEGRAPAQLSLPSTVQDD